MANDIDLINNSTDIYDALDPIIKNKVKESLTFHKILNLTKAFMSKNEYALQTNIIGRRVLVNQKMEDDIYDALGVDKLQVRKAILESTYFKKTFGRELSLTDQFCLAFPLILAALEYKLLGKKEESDLCYLLAHFKPYSSRESLFFKFKVNEGQMLYTIEKSLSERFDIKKYGTILASLQKRAQSSYDNYIADMTKDEKMTDKKLYVCYTSGIAGSVNNFIGGIVELYRKNEGKSMSYENSGAANLDKENDGVEYEDADIDSDVAIKNRIVNRTLMRISQSPFEKKLGIIACQDKEAFASSSQMYVQMLSNIVNEVVDKMFNQLSDFFNALISSFLFHQSPQGRIYTMEDFNSPTFIIVGTDILAGKKSNIKDKNLLRARELFNQMLEDHWTEFSNYGDTYHRKMKKALANYWIYVIKATK